MRSIALAAVSAAAALLSAGSALAALPSAELDAHTLASANNATFGVTDPETLLTNNQFATLASNAHESSPSNLSYANGFALASFGVLKAYADALNTNLELGSAQATAEAESTDYYDGATVFGAYSTTIAITGFTSAQPQFGPGPDALLTYRIDDLTARDTLLLGSWFAPKPMTFNISYTIPQGHNTRVFMDLSVFAYDGAQSQPGVVFSNFKDTVHYFIDSTDGGPDAIGVSGHDYATPSGTPEPASWALMLLGFGALGAAVRRRRAALAAA